MTLKALAIISGGRAASFAHSATADAVTRTLTRNHAAAAGLPLTTTEVSSQAQGMFSIDHTSSGFAQSRSLGPVTTFGQMLMCRIDCTDPDFGMGGDAARSRWLYRYDRRGQITSSSKQRPELDHYVDIENGGWFRSRAYNGIGGLNGDNALNQTTSRETPFPWINGMAPLEQSVTAGLLTFRDSYWWTGMLPRSEDPQWRQHTITAESAGLPSPPKIQTECLNLQYFCRTFFCR